MQTRIVASACAIAAAIGLASSSAMAQLVVGTTTTTTSNPAAIYIDVTSGTQTPLWNSVANKKVNGIAADFADSRMYSNDSARLDAWSFGSLGTGPTIIDGMYRTDGVTFSATGVDGLCWANGQLYGTTSFPSSVFKRGIYSINTTPDAGAHLVMTPLWVDTSAGGGSITLGEPDYNAADGKFYVVSSNDTTGAGGVFGLGVYSIDAFGSGAVNKVADFPAGRTRIDGFAIGGGEFWLTEQDPTNSRIDVYPYDPVSQTYGTTIFVPLTDSTQRASGATWAPGALVPEPGELSMIGAAGWLAFSRRRRAANQRAS